MGNSKKALQESNRMSNTGFYAKLRRGEIKRLPKETNRGNRT